MWSLAQWLPARDFIIIGQYLCPHPLFSLADLSRPVTVHAHPYSHTTSAGHTRVYRACAAAAVVVAVDGAEGESPHAHRVPQGRRLRLRHVGAGVDGGLSRRPTQSSLECRYENYGGLS